MSRRSSNILTAPVGVPWSLRRMLQKKTMEAINQVCVCVCVCFFFFYTEKGLILNFYWNVYNFGP